MSWLSTILLTSKWHLSELFCLSSIHRGVQSLSAQTTRVDAAGWFLSGWILFMIIHDLSIIFSIFLWSDSELCKKKGWVCCPLVQYKCHWDFRSKEIYLGWHYWLHIYFWKKLLYWLDIGFAKVQSITDWIWLIHLTHPSLDKRKGSSVLIIQEHYRPLWFSFESKFSKKSRSCWFSLCYQLSWSVWSEWYPLGVANNCMMGCFAVACILNVYKWMIFGHIRRRSFHSIIHSISMQAFPSSLSNILGMIWQEKKFIECEWLVFQSATKSLLRKKQWPVTWHEIFIGFHNYYSTYARGRIPLYVTKKLC